MNVQNLKTLVTSKAGRSLLLAKKHSPVAMTAAGIVGVIGSTVLVARATLKVEPVLEELKGNLQMVADAGEAMNEKEILHAKALMYANTTLQLGKLYGPALLLGTASIGLLISGHKVLSRRNVALTAAFKGLETSYQRYRDRVVEELGEDKDREFRFGNQSVELEVTDTEGKKTTSSVRIIDDSDLGYTTFLFNNATSTHYQHAPGYNQMFLQQNQGFWNDRLQAVGFVFMNEVLESLGMARTSAGAITGWVKGSETGDSYVSFDIQNLGNGELMLDFNVDGSIWDKIG